MVQQHLGEAGLMYRTRRAYLFAITWLNDFSIMLLIFAVTRQLAEVGYGLMHLGVLGAVFSAAVSLSSIASGALSDRFGRVGQTRIGLLVALVGLILCVVVPVGKWYFVLVYGLVAIGPGFVYPSVIAWVNETAGQRKRQPGRFGERKRTPVSRAILFFCLSWNLGLISGQVTGGVMFAVDPNGPIYIAIGLITTNLILLSLSQSKTKSSSRVEGAQERSTDGVTDGTQSPNKLAPETARLVGWLANIGGAFSVSLVLHLFSDLAVHLEVSPDLHGTLLASMRVVIIAVYLVMHLTSFWHFRFYSQIVVQLFGLGGLIVLTQANGAVDLLFGLTSLGILLGYNYFAGLFYGNAQPQQKGRGFASGMHQGTLAAGLAIGSLGGGVLGRHLGPRSPYYLGIIVLLATILIQIIIVKRGLTQKLQSPITEASETFIKETNKT